MRQRLWTVTLALTHPQGAAHVEIVQCAMVQLDEARKQLDARQKTRAREGSRLRSALTNLEAQAAADAQQVVSAQQAHEELLLNLPSYLSPASLARPPPPILPPKGPVGRPAPAEAVQAPALAALTPSHQLASLSARPHLKQSVPKLTSSHVAPQIMTPHSQGVPSAAAKAALPVRMAPNARSACSREKQPMQQAAWHPTLLQRASAATAQTRHAYTALEQSAQLASLPQGRYSAQWLAAASAQAQALTLQQRVAAAQESPQPLLKRSKLSSLSERAGRRSGSAAAVTARNAPMKKRAEATAGSNKHTLLPAGPETLQEGLMSELMGSMTQQGGFTTQQVGSMTQQMGSMTQQRGLIIQQMGSMTQQTSSMTQQPPSLPLPWARTDTAVHPLQNPAAPSATLSAQAARLHPAAAWTGGPVPVAHLGQAGPGRHKAPVLIPAKPLQSQQCQPQAVPNFMALPSPSPPALALTAAGMAGVAPLLTPGAASLSTQSAAHPSASASAASRSLTAVSVPAASCLAGPDASPLQATPSQQQLVSEMPAQAISGQALTRPELSHQVKAPAQTCHLQAPTCSMAAASASASGMTPVSAAHGLGLTVHSDIYSPGCQMPPSQHLIAQGMLAQPSAAQRLVAVSSAGGAASTQATRVQSHAAQGSGAQGSCPQLQPPATQILSSSTAHACQSVHSSCTSNRAATPNSQESHTDSMPTACISPQLLASASLGLPAELLALFNQAGAYTPHASSSPFPRSRPSYAFPNMQSPIQSASWQTGGSNKSIMPDHTPCDNVPSQQHANVMLGGMY